MSRPRLLVFNCHEAWIHQLGWLREVDLDVVVGLPGRSVKEWDSRMRPLPANARTISLDEAKAAAPGVYATIVCHNLTDILDAKTIDAPKLLILHTSLAGRLAEEPFAGDPEDFKRLVRNVIMFHDVRVCSVSSLKAASWGYAPGEIPLVPFGVDVDDYLPWDGSLAAGLRVSNLVSRRRKILMWEFHEAAFGGLPVTLVGRNPDMPGVVPSSSWDDLKRTLSRHRFFIHTANVEMEDGYNMATVEAMAAGLPILGNRHPSSPVEHGVSGFLSDDPIELRAFAERLIADRDLAQRMGEASRDVARRIFSKAGFVEGFKRAVGRLTE